MQVNRSPDLARTTFQLLALAVLLATSLWILRPFLVALTWATTIVVATWPLLVRVQAWLGGRRSLAVAAMTIALVLILVVHLYLAIMAIVEHAGQIAGWSHRLATFTLPPPPSWVEGLPVVGSRIAARWRELAAVGRDEVQGLFLPYARTLILWFVGQVGSVGLLFVQFLLTVVIAGILYSRGETVANRADRFARRLAGPRGEGALRLAAQAIRAVALGVVVTAIVQSILAGVALAVAGVPFAMLLTVVVFMLAVAQIGPVPVLAPVVIWVWATSGTAWGIVLLVFSLVCVTVDNFLRPLLIRRGADLPLLLIFAGVVGGLIAFGVIGLFIGPVVLAVAHTLLWAWVDRDDSPDEPGASPAGGGEAKP